MASFGTMPGNNAPPPVFGGTNPTGLVPGGFSTKESFGFPHYPMFGGTPSNGMVTPTANLGIFGTPSGSSGGGGGIQGLNSGFSAPGVDPKNFDNINRQLRNDYGDGIGSLLANLLGNGMFNQKTADAFLNAMQPAYNRGMSSIQTAFGAEGSRFGSAAALGMGDFASQFNLNEQQTLASMYMNAQQEQLSLLENILPTVHAEQADSQASGGIMGILKDIFGQGWFGGSFNKPTFGGSGGSGASVPTIGLPGNTSPSASGGGSSPFGLDSLKLMLQGSSAGGTLGGATSTGDLSSLLMLAGGI